MARELSRRARRLCDKLFASSESERIKAVLGGLLVEAIPLAPSSSQGIERIDFSIIKIAAADIGALSRAVELAKLDWRNLLMEAGFAQSVDRHNQWYERVMRDHAE